MSKILVVDDSNLSRRTLKRILEAAGHEVIEAADGISALERYVLERPSLVTLDMVMSGMYGLEVLQKLRDLDAEVRVLVATADVQESTQFLSKDAGALGFLQKPFDKEAVLAAVTLVLAGEDAWT